MDGALHEWVVAGQTWIEHAQSVQTPFLTFFFQSMTFLGKEEFFLLVLPVGYWTYNKSFGRRLLYLLVIAFYFNIFLKNLFRLPRPPDELNLVEDVGFGLPSGHAMSGVALWGYASWWLRRLGGWIWFVAPLLILLVGGSRVYLGVHYPLDVLAGFLFGLIVLLLFLRWEPPVRRWILSQSKNLLMLGAAGVAVVMIFACPGDEAAYPAEVAVSLSAIFWGGTVGILYEQERVAFVARGNWGQRIVRYLVGLLLVLASWYGLRLLFGMVDLSHPLAMVLRFVRYALTGLVMTWWVPALFVRLGVADREITEEQTDFNTELVSF